MKSAPLDHGIVQAHHHGAGPGRLLDGEPQVPALPRLLHRRQASSARSVRRAREASFSVLLMRKSRWALSLSLGLRFSLETPVVAHCRSRWPALRRSRRVAS